MLQSFVRRIVRGLSRISLNLLPLLLVVVTLMRAFSVDAVAGSYTGCEGCFLLPSLGQDAWLLAALCVLVALALTRLPGWLRAAARILAILLLLLAVLDLVVFDLFSQRLYVDDVLHFGGAMTANWSVARAALASAAGVVKAIAVMVALLVMIMASMARVPSSRASRVLLGVALAAVLFALGAARLPIHYVHAELTHNVLAVNLPQGRMQLFSSDFIRHQRDLVAALPQICEQHVGAQPEVIVVLVESLSAWQSHLLGGTVDWTPELDQLARDNHYFSHFYANGFTTSGGEIAVTTGLTPFNPPGAAHLEFSNYVVPETALPAIAHAAGYRANFFTPGDLGFLGVGAWLRQLDFDHVEGDEAAYYQGHKRWQFGAVEDRVFFERFLHWMDSEHPAQPSVSILLTVSGHPPFVNPHGGRIDAEGTFRYIDQELGRFYRALDQRGFFDNGVLLIMGDHRSMTPLAAGEFSQHGERAFARVPLIVAGKVSMPKVIASSFQQTDVLPSLQYLFGQRSCRDPLQGSFLRADPQPAQVITHVRGDDRNRVDVYHGADAVSGYRLDGDASGWLDAPPADAKGIAAAINVQREDARLRRSLPPPMATETR